MKHPSLLLLSILLAACSPQAEDTQPPPAAVVYSISEVDTKPVPTRSAAQQYPSSMKESNTSGWVSLSFVIQADGTTEQIEIKESSHADFESEAILAIQGTRFSPATKNGKPVPCKVSQKLKWNI